MEIKKRVLSKSNEYWSRAEKIIPSGTQTFSKGPTQFVQGVAPIYLERGLGSHVFDVDGNEYIDYPLALGSVTLGYAYPAVNRAIEKQLKNGINFSLMHPLEVELSEMLIKIIPCAEMVRFAKNGSDATAGAVRVARGYTGREKIVCCGYHGWQDWYIGTTTRDLGVPASTKELTIPFEYNDAENLERIFAENEGEIAAVIMEPIIMEEPEANFIEKVKDIAHRNGALLIFDEIVTGFRLALGGAQEYLNVTPDIATVGKGMSNGMPISAVVGKHEIMELFDEVFFSFTFGGETLSLAAAVATINEMQDKNAIEHFKKQGGKLMEGYNKLSSEHALDVYTKCIGLPAHSAIYFKDEDGNESLEIKSLFQQELIKRGILTIGVHNICLSHNDEDIEYTLESYDDSMKILAKGIGPDIAKLIEGQKIQPVFRKYLPTQ